MPTIAQNKEKQKYIDKAREKEKEYNIPSNLLVGLLAQESGHFNKDVISGKKKSYAGAIGVGQFMPQTAKAFNIDPLNVDQAIDASAKYLSSSYKTLGNWDDAILSYNAGVGRVKQYKAGKPIKIKEHAEYVDRVKSQIQRYGGNKTIETPQHITTDLTFLPSTKEMPNLAGVPYIEQQEEKMDKDVEEVKQQTAEYNFLQELQNQPDRELTLEQPQEQKKQLTRTDYNQTFNQISGFIDQDIIAQQGGNINNLNEEQTKSVLEDKQWLDNWLINRKINGQPIPQDFKKPTTDKVYVDELRANEYGYFDTKNENLVLDSVKFGKKKNIGTHELAHQIQEKNPYFNDLIKNPIIRVIEPTSYTSQPEEIHSELMRLRQAEGYKPDVPVTIDQVKTIKDLEGYNLQDLDEGQLLELLNSTASNFKSSNNNYAQQGGKFSENELAFLSEIAVKDNNGYWNPENQGKIVEIQGGNITMEGVNQDLIGISDTGEQKLMKKGKNYNFKGASKVIEIPLFKKK